LLGIFLLYIAIRSYMRPELAPGSSEVAPLRDRISALRSVFLPLIGILSVLIGARRMEALERYLLANPGETRNGVIAGAVEQYLRETDFWQDDLPPDSRLWAVTDRT
jgi:hypothetical protein